MLLSLNRLIVTCFKSSKGTLLDVLLTNKPKSFQKTFVCETGLSDCHKLVATIFRSTFIKLPPKVVKYRSYKNFDENKFCHDLDQILIKRDIYKAKDPYNKEERHNIYVALQMLDCMFLSCHVRVSE